MMHSHKQISTQPLPDRMPDSWREREAEKRTPPFISMKDVLWFLYLYPLRMLVSPLPSRSLYRIGRALEPVFRFVTRKKRIIASRSMAVAFCTEATADFISTVSRRYVSNAVYRALDDFTMMHPKASAALKSLCENR